MITVQKWLKKSAWRQFKTNCIQKLWWVIRSMTKKSLSNPCIILPIRKWWVLMIVLREVRSLKLQKWVKVYLIKLSRKRNWLILGSNSWTTNYKYRIPTWTHRFQANLVKLKNKLIEVNLKLFKHKIKAHF